MKSVQEIARAQIAATRATATQGTRQSLNSGSSECSTEAMSNAVMLWGRMREIYGEKWSRDHGATPPEDVKSVWMQAIGRQSRNRLQVAIGKCIRRHPKWPPSVSEFVLLCDIDAEELGLPDVEFAFNEAQKYCGMVSHPEWSHQAIHEAAKRVGIYDIQHATTKGEQESVRRRFRIEYDSLAKAMANGQVLLENDRQHHPDRYIERKMIEEGNAQAEKMGFSGVKGQDAINTMKEWFK